MKKLGFGFMRPPMLGDNIDTEQLSLMVDEFIAAGFSYFDVARNYLSGRCETLFRECVSSRHPRSSFLLADKLTNMLFESESDIRPLFARQLADCGVEYFDYYLMHAQNARFYEKYKACNAYQTAFALKREGLVRHVGMSFHDSPAVLDMILTEQPEIEFVQLQFNYVDYEDPNVRSRECLEVCRKHGKTVTVMEPVRGGCLAMLPPEAEKVFASLGGGSPASYAVRYCASFNDVTVVLSGMSNLAQMRDNIGIMADFKPLDLAEQNAVQQVKEILSSMNQIPCTACRYCVDGCPAKIAIPSLFFCLNSKRRFSSYDAEWYYSSYTKNRGKASDCISCGQCEAVCPQGLEIRRLLGEVANELEK